VSLSFVWFLKKDRTNDRSIDVGKYPQAEVHHPSGEVTVTKGDVVPLEAKDREFVEPPKVTPPKEDVAQTTTTTTKSFDTAASEPRPPLEKAKSIKDRWQPQQQQQQQAPRPPGPQRKISARGSVADRYLQNIQGT